jgi:hypothetical protein
MQLISWLHECIDLLPKLKQLNPTLGFEPLRLGPALTNVMADPAAGLFLFVLARCSDMESLIEIAASLDSLDEEVRARLLSIFDLVPGLASGLIDRCWLAERDRLQPNWEQCLAALDRIEHDSEDWAREDLRQAVVRAKAAVIYEFRGNTDGALNLLREDRSGGPFLADQEATILQNQGEHAAAWAIWKAGLPEWSTHNKLDEVTLAFAHKKAAISAGYLGEWNESARLFLEASTRLEAFQGRHNKQADLASSPDLVPLRLLADYAVGLWRAGNHKESITAFEVVISRVFAVSRQLELLTKPGACYPWTQYAPTSRRQTLGANRSSVTAREAKAERRTASYVGSCSVDRHPVCPSQWHPLGDAPQGDGLWERHDLLAPAERMAKCRPLGTIAPPAPG